MSVSGCGKVWGKEGSRTYHDDVQGGGGKQLRKGGRRGG